MPRFAGTDLEQTPTAAAFRGNARRAIIPFGVGSRAMWRSSKCAEDHHKTDDDDRWPSRVQRVIYETVDVGPRKLRRFRRCWVLELLDDWAGPWPQIESAIRRLDTKTWEERG